MKLAPLDKQTQDEFSRIVNKDPSALTPGEKLFLKARKAYMGERALNKFKAVLK